MRKVALILFIVFFFSCESEKIPYHCLIHDADNNTLADSTGNIVQTDYYYADIDRLPSIWSNVYDTLTDVNTYDGVSKDVAYTDRGVSDVISGKPCSQIGITPECDIDESCYPFVECGGVCRKCGNSLAGSSCEIHSDCKCGMACLSLSDRKLTCYKVCTSNADCPSGQTCTDGWSGKYEHEYYKICRGLINKNEEVK
ncbi:MAG: hypothetical protein N2746_04365 [Deltaproteobacteria bacterium]|nr:hypothetical protein [Deltaproteobacteria bacterium]